MPKPKNQRCERCGEPSRGRFCSKRCYGDSKLLPALPPRTCDLCGVSFVPKRHSFTTAAYQGAFCSRTCANKARKRPLAERFAEMAARAERTERGCLLWPGAREGAGYGVITGDDGTQVRVPRLAYELRYGPLPVGAHVLHRCDTPPCFEAAHLFAGTNAENMADKIAKGRDARGERHGQSRLTAADILTIRQRYAGGESQQAIATDYGVSQVSISVIVRRKGWKHVP